MKNLIKFDSPIGEIAIAEEHGKICNVFFDCDEITLDFNPNENETLKKTKAEILEYLGGKRKEFSISFKIDGTPFEKVVYEKMVKIPYGKTLTYGELAKLAGKPKAARAVGTICGKNALALFVPCHRVVRASGNKLKFRGGENIKKFLMDLEKIDLKI